MTTRTLRHGALTGAVAGMMMGMVAMVAMVAIGHGFLTPINAMAHTIWRGAPLGPRFSGDALALGLSIHMMISMALGVTIFGVADGLHFDRTRRVAIALALPAAAWLGQLVLLPVVDKSASLVFTPWVLAVGHAVFAMVAVAAVLIARSIPAGSPTVPGVAVVDARLSAHA
ncbi:MAG: hypothetical protein ACYCS7_09090 [Acidimicrobiales bacterium]